MLLAHIPVKSDSVAQFLLVHIAIQHIVADIGSGPFHAFDEYLSLSDIEVVVQKLPCMLCLPEEVFSNVTPELYKTNKQIIIIIIILAIIYNIFPILIGKTNVANRNPLLPRQCIFVVLYQWLADRTTSFI